MLTIYSFVSLLNRDRLSVNTLALTAFIMLLINPFSLFDVGFQLSFMAVWAIMVFYSPIYHALSDKLLGKSIIMRYLWAMLVVSFSAQIGTAPLIMYYFGRFSTVSLLTGLRCYSYNDCNSLFGLFYVIAELIFFNRFLYGLFA